MSNKTNAIGSNIPTLRIVFIQASEIYYANHYTHRNLEIKNSNGVFDSHFEDLMPLNLDLIYLLQNKKTSWKTLGKEQYTLDFINVSFKYPLRLDENDKQVFKGESVKTISSDTMRKELYTDGFVINGKQYVRYKRSAGSAKGGSCLFIKKELYALMNKWSLTGLDENDVLSHTSLTSYEAYRALSLSSLIDVFRLNPYNILFVKDFDKYSLKNQDVINVTYENNSLLGKRETIDVTNNIFDGEGLLDSSIFKQKGKSNKGMMLLRNRFFKCCAFNTNLQQWFKENNIESVNQLHGITFATKVSDIKLVVSESCLKYVKMLPGGFIKSSIKKWCEAISDENDESIFGVVKTDKPTRFFNGDMVETTYQLLNTLQLPETDVRKLLLPYIDYIKKIRNIKDTPEYAMLYLQGEVNEYEEEYEDDSEDQPLEGLFNYSSYSFKNKVCFDLMKIRRDFIKTNVFKNHIFKSVISSFRLKLYGGRILIDGNYATLFGNPLEFLKYIIKKFDYDNISSSLGENEIYCSFFKDGEELVGSRAPHMTMGNILYAKNKRLNEVDKWFNLTRNIVVVDAINNNIQQRLNGADYDSDSMLLTNNDIIVKAAKKHYLDFPVPCVGFGHNERLMEKLSSKKKMNLLLNAWKIDCSIANNNVGRIVNLSQLLNSHLWNELNNRFDYEELYNNIAILSVLAGAEIDSSKRTFDFDTLTEFFKINAFAKNNGYSDRPAFFFYIANGKKQKPKIGEIETYVRSLDDKTDYFKTTMDYLWKFANGTIDYPKTETIPLFDLIKEEIPSSKLTGTNYKQIENALMELKQIKEEINKDNFAKKDSSSYELEKREFDNRINECYQKIKTAINNTSKAKKFIKDIEKETSPYSLLYLFLYIVSLKHEELGYGYEDLFDSDGGVPRLKQVIDKSAPFSLFDKYYYQRDLVDNLISKMFK